MLPILCVSLKRAVERRSLIEREWIMKRECPIQFIEAFDRREIVEGREIYKYDINASIGRIGRPLSSGERACATSHALAVKQAIDKNYEEVVIIEDDSYPNFSNYRTFVDYVKQCRLEFPDVKIGMLGSPVDKGFTTSERKQYFSLLVDPSWGCVGTYLHNSIYQDYYNKLISMSGASDHYWWDYVPSKEIAISNTHLAIHQENMPSYIGNEFRSGNRIFNE